MKRIIVLLFYIIVSHNCFSQRKVLLDEGWRFHRGNIANAEQTNFNDNSWRNIDLPHDWSIEDLPGTESPFNPNAINGVSVGFTTGGIGWYRKIFTLPANQQNKRISILFDGVYMNSDVWINGVHLGNHPYGYTSFYYDITDKIKRNGKNIIAVQVKNEGANSRWYAGSGINRHVWLIETSPIHVVQWGTYITTPEVSALSANVAIQTKVKNETGASATITLINKIVNAKGVEVARTSSKKDIPANDRYAFKENAIVKSPALWSNENPDLYKAITEVYVGGKLSDKVETKFGIRKISFDAANGFMLNNKPMKLKGGCFHIDNGPLGARSFDRAEIRRVALMKASGFNAIRCSHNPPAPAFLDACDSMGMLVIDEAFDCWTEGKNADDYHVYFKNWWQRDLQSMLLRDRNHPSIIMWSIGNEIPGMDKPSIADTAELLADYVRSIDNTRPVTDAVVGVSDQKDAFFSALDICGYNYANNKYVSDHHRKPNRIMFSTESYPLDAYQSWMDVLDHPWVIGDFVWTGFDYIGESSLGWRGYPQNKNFYPWNLAYCGDIDICGWKRPQSFYRDALWKKDQLSIFVKPLHSSFPVNPKKEPWSIWNWDDVVANWNWKGDKDSIFEVDIYSSCDEVELFLNNKSLGKKPTNRSTKFRTVYNVPYASGELKAVGYDNGEIVKASILKTADKPVQIKLFADRKIIKANNEDLSYVGVELVDKNGIRNPDAKNLIHFKIEGPGTIVGVGNADPQSLESYQLPQRKAWQGRCLVIIKSGKNSGNIILRATTIGLKSAEIAIKVN
ncbi:glycoside hydrolase family 2 TIM barrel-domain containing protein [Arachidicoccus sp.]|uniref:glycoside hydrolase family 2 TIM barrel-domain containing protein n=1 Tax=Arachidicoccus sp. TaxID=1872624 RepID=UPI003D2253BE